MKNSIVVFSSLLILFILTIACNNNVVETVKNDKIANDSLPEILKEDSLAKELDVVVADTFDNGSPLKIAYVDDNNPNDVKYEKKFYQSGNIFMEGPLKDARRDGKWIAWYENGVIWSVGYYVNGLKHGASEVYYENGQTRYTKNYEEDVAEGLWQFYDEQGNLLGEVMYENGQILWQKGSEDMEGME